MNTSLHRARKEKNDEFYTQLTDIEKELKHYKSHFKDKVVYCNCDDPEWSNFWIYFSRNFEHLGLKKLISTHFEKDKPSYKLEIQRDINKDNKVDHLDTIKTELKQNGDFRSKECIELLKKADIVVTNPPFSLFREFVAQLTEYNKDFLILGNTNAITYKEIFKIIRDNRMWLGVSPRSLTFILPDGSKKSVNACWYTNLTHKKINEELILYKEFNENDYQIYDNYNAIEVSKVADIPVDYEGLMGVPITFLCKFNPDQFEIIDGIGKYSMLTGPTDDTKGKYLTMINGIPKYARIIIKNKNPTINKN